MHRRLIIFVALVVLVIDQTTKVLAVHYLQGRPSVQVLGKFLQLTLARNSGAAFSLATGATAILSVIALGACVAILRTANKVNNYGWALVFGGVLGGASGNLVDRVLRAPGLFVGHVIDFLELPHWPIFNIADSAIVCSAIGAVVLTIRGSTWTSELGQR